MTPALLAELSDLFTREAFEADTHGNSDEAERLWDVADEIRKRFEKAEHVEARRLVR